VGGEKEAVVWARDPEGEKRKRKRRSRGYRKKKRRKKGGVDQNVVRTNENAKRGSLFGRKGGDSTLYPSEIEEYKKLEKREIPFQRERERKRKGTFYSFFNVREEH